MQPDRDTDSRWGPCQRQLSCWSSTAGPILNSLQRSRWSVSACSEAQGYCRSLTSSEAQGYCRSLTSSEAQGYCRSLTSSEAQGYCRSLTSSEAQGYCRSLTSSEAQRYCRSLTSREKPHLTTWQVVASHNLQVLSPEAVSSWLLSGPHATCTDTHSCL